MDKTKKPLQLNTLGKTRSSPVKKGIVSSSKISDAPMKSIIIDNVTFLVREDIEENYNNIKTLNDIIELDSRKPHLVQNISPMLFKHYFDNKTGKIKTYVQEGDRVKIDSQYLTKNDTANGQVKQLKLANLGDMSVVVAILTDKRKYVAKALTKWQGDV